MLAQSFMSAADLGINEPQRGALQKVLVLLETGKLIHSDIPDYSDFLWDKKPSFTNHFNMEHWGTTPTACGTVACIGGTAELVGNIRFGNLKYNNKGLLELFNPPVIDMDRWCDITPAQAARALRSYLTSGDAKWSEAVAA